MCLRGDPPIARKASELLPFKTLQRMYFEGRTDNSLTEIRIKDNNQLDVHGLTALMLGIPYLDMLRRFATTQTPGLTQKTQRYTSLGA
jgi:hypothetical protein